ncbi:MAG TPA: hypothetical protein VIT68_01215 [Candidatus Gracilibacteria bacterium]
MDLHKAIESIFHRNRRVEQDKAWETSLTRRTFLAVTIYLCAAATLALIGTPQPLMEAGVPVLGYVISTLTLPWIRELWEKHHKN